jgi:phage anti-repressor protein
LDKSLEYKRNWIRHVNTWTIEARDASRITAAEMKYMRGTAGYIWTDYKANIQITKELKITPILDKLLEYRRNWIRNVNTWTIEARDGSRITAAEMKYMRTAGYIWTDYKANIQITKELKITLILDKLLEYKRNWIQHVNRMPCNKLHRVMKQYCVTGRRNHGRPLKRLLDT